MDDQPSQNIFLMEVLSNVLLFLQGALFTSGVMNHRPRWAIATLALSALVVMVSRMVMIMSRERLLRMQHRLLTAIRNDQMGRKVEEIRHG